MMLRGDKGPGLCPAGLVSPPRWTGHPGAMGRPFFVLGTDGYIEIRKYTNVAVSKQGNKSVPWWTARRASLHRLQQWAPLTFRAANSLADIVGRTQHCPRSGPVPCWAGGTVHPGNS